MQIHSRLAKKISLPPMSSPALSVIVPIFNEEKNIPVIYKTLTKELSGLEYEIIFVNDGSRDTSWTLLREIALGDLRVTALNFSRNFGHQAALTAGYAHARGDAVVTMDADMQDPPALIHDMLAQWRQGAQVVYARRTGRKDTWLKRTTARAYYALLDSVSDVRMPRNVGDFRLVDKKVVQYLNNCKERSRYLRGMVAWSGFKAAFVDFDRPDRAAGVTGYTWQKMFKLAFDGLTGFSLFPLKIAAYVGAFVIASGCAMLTYITVDAVLFSVRYPLFKWLVTVIYIFMGVQFLLLWLLGEYIGRIYDQQRERPQYIVDELLSGHRND